MSITVLPCPLRAVFTMRFVYKGHAHQLYWFATISPGHVIKPGIETGMKRNEITCAYAWLVNKIISMVQCTCPLMIHQILA